MSVTTPHVPVVLASASPRRHELFALLDIPFTVCTAGIDETPQPAETPAQTAARLARSKAAAVAAHTAGVIIAADTVVVLDDEILGKPADRTEAVSTLRRLRDRAHQVMTGFSALKTDSGEVRSEVVCTDVWMRAYTDEEIETYVATGDPMDKAGAYAIQHPTFAPVTRLDGCPANVMGLPVCWVAEALLSLGLTLGSIPTQGCRPRDSICAIRGVVIPN